MHRILFAEKRVIAPILWDVVLAFRVDIRFVSGLILFLWGCSYTFSSRPFALLVKCRDFFNLSKSVCADCEDDSSSVLRYMDTVMRREKGKLCLFKRKDKSFVSNRRSFCETIFRFSSHSGDD